MAFGPTQSAWNGSAQLGLGWGLFVGCAGDNSPHAHHAVQIVLSASPQRLWTAKRGWQRCHGAVIGADVEHRLAESTDPVTLLYLEPDSPEGRRVLATLAEGWRELSPEATKAALSALRDGSPQSPAQHVADYLCPSKQPSQSLRHDPLVESLLLKLPQSLPDRLGIGALASKTGLSASRLQHRFRAYTGLAVRPYLRWRRLLTALDGVTRGLPLTEAALDAGFADAAHFTRTFRRHFGIAPSVLLRLKTKGPTASN